MNSVLKYLTGGIASLALILACFLFAIRGCLSKYDERYALPPALHFEKKDSAVLFSLVKYNETTTYSQEGGIINKTFSRHCFIQVNDALTGRKILDKEIKRPDRIKNYNESILGASGDTAWLFIDELIAFDPFTLQKVVDKDLLEDKNPSLKGKLPDASTYYQFNAADQTIRITVNDGSKWSLDTHTLEASLYDSYKMNPNETEEQGRLKRLQRINPGYTEMMVNQDTTGKHWWGLYSKEEMAKINPRVSLTPSYNQESRRQLFASTMEEGLDDHLTIKWDSLKDLTPGEYFLDGGFLLDKATGKRAVPSDPTSALVVYKSKIGSEGTLLLCRITQDGSIAWKLNTGLTSWADWISKGNRLFIFGNNNKELTNMMTDLLLSIDLGSGKATTYDYSSGQTGQLHN